MKYRSILNDVLGPIMNGPSSSHSAGCCRIGLTIKSLFGREITRAEVVFEEAGSYPNTYIGQGSDFGFTGGLLGYDTDNPQLKNAVKIAREMGRKISFSKEKLGYLHPNQAEVRIYDDANRVVMTAMTFSVGGGMFEIRKLDEFDVMIDGNQYQFFVYFLSTKKNSLKRVVERLNVQCDIQTNELTGRSLISISASNNIYDMIKTQFGELEGFQYIRYSVPVVSVVRNNTCLPPFINAKQALKYAMESKKELWELCAEYETCGTNASSAYIHSIISKIRVVMEKSMIPPDPQTTISYGYLPYHASLMKMANSRLCPIRTGCLNNALIAAIAVLENSCAHNIVVAAPTAGSSGILPASIIAIGKEEGFSDLCIEKALMAAGVVGVFIANQATFGGEIGGCQAEIGSASAMAAAGVVHLFGGTIEQSFSAASLALQNLLGLICDPVAGLTEIPCISRNVSAVSNAIMSASMVLLGFDSIIPLDEAIETMFEVGQKMSADFKCTCNGGLCITPTGKRVKEVVQNQFLKL